MLLAEIHGKRCTEARASEDYLTSAVFGHLRWVEPSNFWSDLFARAKTVSGDTLLNALESRGLAIPKYERLTILFWKSLRGDEPDLLLHFQANGLASLVILVEAKLNAGKSGSGENDQLIRYLKALDDLEGSTKMTNVDAFRAVLYLTAHSATNDLRESIDAPGANETTAGRLFNVQWQDILEVAALQAVASGPELLGEVAIFLRRVGLERFRGFKVGSPLHQGGSFYRRQLFGALRNRLVNTTQAKGNFYV